VIDGIAALDRSLADDVLALCARRALTDSGWFEASRLVEIAIERLDDASVDVETADGETVDAASA
jgi:hypothetical protein